MIKAASSPLEINTQSAPSFPTYNPAQQNRTFMAGSSMPPSSVQAAQISTTQPTAPSVPNNATGAVMPTSPKFPDPTQTNLVRADGSTANASGSDGEGDNPGQPKKKLNLKMAIGVIVLFLVVLGSGAGFYLTQQSQDLRQQASSTGQCPAAQECPSANDPTILDSCDSVEGDGTPNTSVCSSQFVGRIESCGGTPYCCNGSSWSTNMTACPVVVVPDSCNDACTTNAECTNINSSWTCDATSNKCRLASNPTSITCAAAAALACNDTCTSNTQCTSVNSAWTCDATSNKCRLASNPTSISCAPAEVALTCNDTCTSNTQCTSVNSAWTCDATSNKCRLASNPTSITCQAAAALTCNDACTTNTQCSSVDPDWSCDTTSNKCRLTSNPTSTTCQAAAAIACNDTCTSNTQCSSVNPAWSCDMTTSKCRLTANPTSTTCAAATEELACNDACTSNAECTAVNPNWICSTITNKCRLASNPTSTTCAAAAALTCNDACTTDSQCTSANAAWTCDDTSDKCRLTANPTSTTCAAAAALTCNDTCTSNTQCSSVNSAWTCDMTSSKCRLTANPTSTTCAAAVANTVTCDEFSGTLTAGTVLNQTTEMTYRLEYSGDEDVTSAQVTIHGNFDGPGWVGTWADLGVDNTLSDGIFTGVTTYEDIVDLLVATGHNRQQIIDEGVIYSADVYGASGFCQSDNTLSVSGAACDFNAECQGIIKLKPVDATELECNDSCTTDAQCTDANAKWTCDATSDKCRLKSNPTSTTCKVKVINDDSDDVVAPIVGCNQTCVSNIDCTNDKHICVTTADGSNKCRLESYTSSTSCVIPAGATPQPSLPATLPETGPENWINWLKAGLTTLGIGAVLFYLL